MATLASVPTRAGAQGTDAALATELFNAGRELMNEGQFEAALPKLAQSARLDAKVGTLARLAECEEKLRQTVAARGHWQQAANLARAEGDARLGHVEAELDRIDRVVPKLDVTLAGPVPPGLSLRIDAVDAGAASLGLPLPVAPGRHTLVVAAPGKKTRSLSVDTSPDGAVTPVEIPALEDEPALVVASLPPSMAASFAPLALQPADSGGSGNPLRTIGLGVAGAGLATAAVGIVFGVLAKVNLDQSNRDGCVAGTASCSGNGFGERSTAFSDGTVATVLLVAGGAAVATGVTIFAAAPRAHEGLAVRAALLVHPGSIAVEGHF